MEVSGLYTDRTNGAVARTSETLPEDTKRGLISLIERRVQQNWFAEEYPINCPDREGVTSTDTDALDADLAGVIPGLGWPLSPLSFSDDQLFDLLEYLGRHVAEPSERRYHKFFNHAELQFDRQSGSRRFRAAVNELLARGGTAFELDSTLRVQRVAPLETRAVLAQLRPNTGDATLDSLIESGRDLYASHNRSDRLSAIQQLWDGFERLKTLDDPTDKKRSVQILIAFIMEPTLHPFVDEEMQALTRLGNNFQIRHHEMSKPPLPPESYDYVVARLASLLVFLLTSSGRSE